MAFNFQPIIQQYTPPPVAEFDALGSTLNQRYETNIAAMDELDIVMAQINTLEGSRHIKDQAVKDIRNTLKDITAKGDYENAAPKVRLAAKRLATDENLKTAMTNYQNATKWDEELRQAKLQGINMLEFGDYRTERFDDKGRLLSNTVLNDNQKRLDWEGRQSTYFDQIQPETISVEESGYRQGANGLWERYGEGSATGGITAQRIIDQATLNLDNYLQTSEGQQQMKYLTSDRYGKLTAEQAKNQIFNNLVSSGMERVFVNSSTKTSSDYMPNPYKQETLMDLQIANSKANLEAQKIANKAAQAKMAETQNYSLENSMSEIYRTESEDLGGNLDISSIMKRIGSSDSNVSNTTYTVFEDKMRTIAATDKGEAGKQAKSMYNYMNALKRAFPNSYKQVLSATESIRPIIGTSNADNNKRIETDLKANSPAFAQLLKTNPENAKKVIEAAKAVTNSTRSSTNIAVPWRGEESWNLNKKYERTPLEKAVKESGNTYETDFIRPNTLFMEGEQRSAWNSWSEGKNNNANEYKLVSGDDEKFKGEMKLAGISSGNYKGGKIVAELIDKDGNVYLAEPKGRDKLTSFSNFIKDDNLRYLHHINQKPMDVVRHMGLLNGNPKGQNELVKIAQSALYGAKEQNNPDVVNSLFTPTNGNVINVNEVIKLMDKINNK